MSAKGITIVSASAGSGKTYRLTQEVTSAIDPAADKPVALEGLVAVTYTRKANAELAARIRHTLVQKRAYEDAMQLPLAYLGTVHAACLRLLQEFALDAGLSPNVDVLAGSESKLLRQALESSLDQKTCDRIVELAWRVELRLAGQTKRIDWLTPVAEIMELARSNRIAPEKLAGMAERSLDGLFALLPEPAQDGAALDSALAMELDAALLALRKRNDGKQNTAGAIELIEQSQKKLSDGEMRWSDWAKLATKCTPSKACESAVLALRAVAADYERHPRMRGDLKELTYAIFDAAREGLTAYQAWKTQRRVVDYVDMLDRALDIVEHPRAQRELADRLALVVVDEFQDTSPIQLALFARLHALSGRSVWVGDRKQCIFEYAGADPLLMDAIASWVERTGGTRDQLQHNYRSRPELVKACSELFVAALDRHGFVPGEVQVSPKRDAPAALAKLPPFGVWWLETEKDAEDANAIAEGVRRMLANPDGTPVVDRATKEVRSVRPGDIAVLVTTNRKAREAAKALHTRGIRAAVARAGLLSTPEGTLIDAALRFTLDERDSLAAATIEALTGFGGQTADAWLEARLRQPNGDASAPWRVALAKPRADLALLSPSEVLDEVMDALDAAQLCARWPDAPQRIANLDALRALAASYEKRCDQEREAATVAGLLRTFDDLREERLVADEMLSSDDQHVPADDGAVVVCTYHKAKGLEWPVVILADLDRDERRHAFDVAPESDASTFDPARPLEGRWIRFWPWPLGATTKAPLRDKAATSDTGKRVAMREDKERARLLYVGFTRARDHLVLAVRLSTTKSKGTVPQKEWLDALCDAQGTPLLALPTAAADGTISDISVAKTHAVAARVWRMSGTAPEKVVRDASGARWFARPPSDVTPRARPSYWITPSSAEANSDDGEPRTGLVERLTGAMLVGDEAYDYDALGNAVHAFLAADVDGLAKEQRLARAKRLVEAHALTGVIRAESLVEAGDRLRAWVESRWPGAKWHREIPVDAFVTSEHGEQRVRGIIDLLLEIERGYVVVDHKTFPGTTEASWRAKCLDFAPQLAAYARILPVVAPKRVLGQWVHLPVGGAMIEVLA